MKKIFSILLLIFCINMPVFAVQELYSLKSVQKADVVEVIYQALLTKKYTVKQKNPFLAVKKDRNTVVILRQSGEDLFLYLESDSSLRSLRNAILQNYRYDPSYNTNYLKSFSEQANRIIKGQTKTYTFDNPNKVPEIKSEKLPDKSGESIKGYVGKIGKGEHFQAYIQNPINTATAKEGDIIIAVLTKEWKAPNGYTIAKKDSVFEGHLESAKPAQYGMRNARVSLVFDKLTTTEGNIYPISTKSIEFVVDNEGKFSKITKKVTLDSLVGGLAGAAIGGIGALISGDANAIWHGAVIGAGIAGVSSGIGAAAERGADVEIPAYTEIEIEPDKDIDVVFSY